MSDARIGDLGHFSVEFGARYRALSQVRCAGCFAEKWASGTIPPERHDPDCLVPLARAAAVVTQGSG